MPGLIPIKKEGRFYNMSEIQCNSTSEVACNLMAFNTEERSHYHQLRTELTTNLTFEKITGGYAFLYPNQSSTLVKLAEWISYENRCCPFINFSLHVNGISEIIRVELTGAEDIEKLLRIEFNLD